MEVLALYLINMSVCGLSQAQPVGRYRGHNARVGLSRRAYAFLAPPHGPFNR